MKIVVLDGYTLNPGDLSWGGIQKHGDCAIYDRTKPEEILSRAKDAEILFTNKTELNRGTLEKLPKLKFIGVLATGYNVIDVKFAAEKGIPVCNIPTYGTASVAQMTFALLLELTQHVAYHSSTVHAGRWSKSSDFCYWDYPLVELEGLVLGVVGIGHIGRSVAKIGQSFGMKTIAYDKFPPKEPIPGVEMVELDTLFAGADVVSLHCPLFPETQGLVNATRLAKMKPTALLINTSRGPLVDESALADALRKGTIAGAGVDVLAVEPPRADHPLLGCKNCLITPHISWATDKARRRLMDQAVANLEAFLAGKPINVVNQK